MRRQRRWQSPPLVDTVDKMQAEADAVIASYASPIRSLPRKKPEFIYGLNRLNVAARPAKCVVPAEAAARCRRKCWTCRRPPAVGVHELVQAVSRGSPPLTFDLEDGVRATAYRARNASTAGCDHSGPDTAELSLPTSRSAARGPADDRPTPARRPNEVAVRRRRLNRVRRLLTPAAPSRRGIKRAR
jgi:hypothetical protein